MATSRRQFLKAAVAVPIALTAGVQTVRSSMLDEQRFLDALYRARLDNISMAMYPRMVVSTGRQMGKTEMVRQQIKWSVLNDSDVWSLGELTDEMERDA